MTDLQAKTKAIAQLDIGVRETDGENNSPRIRQYLAHCNLVPPSAYCASACSTWVHEASQQLNIIPQFIKAGSALHLFNNNPQLQISPSDLTADDLPVIGINEDIDQIHGHAFVVTGLNGTQLTTIDPNSNDQGSSHGIGVFLLHIRRTTDTNRKGYIRIQ